MSSHASKDDGRNKGVGNGVLDATDMFAILNNALRLLIPDSQSHRRNPQSVSYLGLRNPITCQSLNVEPLFAYGRASIDSLSAGREPQIRTVEPCDDALCTLFNEFSLSMLPSPSLGYDDRFQAVHLYMSTKASVRMDLTR
jgi:hypothetical protein